MTRVADGSDTRSRLLSAAEELFAERGSESVSLREIGRAAAIPVARAGEPADIAHTVSFLVSEGAGFVSGQVIYVAGGPRA